MEEDIKILEEIIKFSKEQFENTGIYTHLNDKEILAIEHLIERNRELENKMNFIQPFVSYTHRRVEKILEDNDYIPKSKVREILEKIENRNYNDYTQKQDGNEVKYEILRDIQELLEN